MQTAVSRPAHEILGQPLTLPNGLILPNRLAKAAMSEALGTADNRVTHALEQLYSRWSEGGAGLLITGNVMVDRRALGEPGNIVLEDDRDRESLRRWASAGTRQGNQLWMQLNHPGKQAPQGLNRETVAPSAVPFVPALQRFFATPRALEEAGIEDIIQRFGTAARLAKEAGFTGVQIHGAHGYLVGQFLSPHHNVREDQWGGSPENRRRFVLRVLAAIRDAVGTQFPVGIKLNSADFQKGGFGEAESIDTFKALAAAGVDMIEISGGTYEAPAMTGVRAKESTRQREAYFLEFAEKARAAVDTPLMLTGGFRTAEGMAAAIDSGAIDLVGLARLLAIEPDAPNRLLAGHATYHHVRPIRTGIKAVDRMALMEITWYTRQLRRMGKGRNPKPTESGFKSFLIGLLENGWGTFKTKRMRA